VIQALYHVIGYRHPFGLVIHDDHVRHNGSLQKVEGGHIADSYELDGSFEIGIHSLHTFQTVPFTKIAQRILQL